MPRMNMSKCAAAMCGVKAYDNGFQRVGSAVSYRSGEYGQVVEMIARGATDDDVIIAYPAWRGCLNAVRRAMSDSK